MKSSLYVGEIEHRRFSPVQNEFTYAVCYYFLDLDEVQKIFRWPLFFSYNFPGILSFWSKDYLGDKAAIAKIIREKTGEEFLGSVRLLTNISYFGYCFNPVSFYYCYDREENLKYIISQVTNTPWGEKHMDFFTFKGDKKNAFALPKVFHVSPFIPMNIDYTFVFNRPDENIHVLMQDRYTGEKEVFFDSTLTLERKDLSLKNVLFYFLKFPLVTFKTSLAIYFQAGVLYFLKKSPFYTHPKKQSEQ